MKYSELSERQKQIRITNKVRGLLCHNCNVSLGHFKDSTDILKNAIYYLEKNNGMA